eukprot:CAMPEP_0116542586 /NCGR_PEP_ID=MMETSP0397-20121206/1095_1 /TAXON_ID=216820 /ORGANISM="Cyclophora tenuis, Strain ECT3854" /LENGTH=322 /DNA_ID=CAMNT_0004066605 /DNA_START=62 /DNA_END=1030 /DNA_ORIENTATION=-
MGRDNILHNTGISQPSSEGDASGLSLHERQAFMNVGTRLARDSNRGSLASSQAWFAQFSDRDWLQFQNDAEMVLNALEPPSSLSSSKRPNENDDDDGAASVALPPEAPPTPTLHCMHATVTTNYDAREFLPPAFICSLCDDAIVGSTTLSCGCAKATVCRRCWVSHSTLLVDSGDDDTNDDGGGMVAVEHYWVCPSCTKLVERAVPCQAMDIAVLHCVKALPQGLPVQTAYYRRLKSWREEVLRHRKQQRGRDGRRAHNEARDRLLAELIQQEEELFWRRKKRPFSWKSQGGLHRIGEVVLVVVGAGFALGAFLLSSKGRRG